MSGEAEIQTAESSKVDVAMVNILQKRLNFFEILRGR